MTRVKVGRCPEMPVDDARKAAEKILVDMNAGINPNEAKRKERTERGRTLKELFDLKLSTPKSQKLKASTKAFYEQTFNRHLAKWGNKRVKEITLEEATALHAAIGKDSPYSANAAIKILRGILSFQESIDITYRNPLRGFSESVGLFEEEPRKNFISKEDLPKWYEAVNGLWNDTARDYLLLLLYTGLRRNEGMGLRWENIDLVNNIMTIPDTKNKLVHRLPIPSPVITMLNNRKAVYGGGMYVFPASTKSGHLTTVQHVLKDLVDTPGVPDFQLHDIRRTFANQAAEVAPWQVVKWLLNHRSKSDVTDRHYVTPDIEFLREPMEKIALELLRIATTKI